MGFFRCGVRGGRRRLFATNEGLIVPLFGNTVALSPAVWNTNNLHKRWKREGCDIVVKRVNKREVIRNLLEGKGNEGYTPAAFFLHFDPEYHRGQAAVDKHLEFFRYTDMDFVKIQYEHHDAETPQIHSPDDWTRIPRYGEDYFTAPLRVVEGLVQEAKSEAMVITTLYSPTMWASRMAGDELLMRHAQDALPKVQQGMEAITESIRSFVRACVRLGVDGFYTSTQGGETHRFADRQLFDALVKPYDLSLMEEINETCDFNILHVCDYSGSYDDFERFLDYPGHVVNSPLEVRGERVSPQTVAALFERPYMGGLDRLGVLATGSTDEVRAAAKDILAEAPQRFILGADCTVPSDTPWENLKAAIEVAHGYSGQG